MSSLQTEAQNAELAPERTMEMKYLENSAVINNNNKFLWNKLSHVLRKND